MVLMLFGVTIIGTEFPQAKTRPWAALSALLVFVALTLLFLRSIETLNKVSKQPTEDIHLFAAQYSDFVIIFALIGSSLLYGTIKMAGMLKARRSQDV